MIIQTSISVFLINLIPIINGKVNRLLLIFSFTLISYLSINLFVSKSFFSEFGVSRLLENNQLSKVILTKLKQNHPDRGGSNQRFLYLKQISQTIKNNRTGYDVCGITEDSRQELSFSQKFQYCIDIQGIQLTTYYLLMMIFLIARDSKTSLIRTLLKLIISISFFFYENIEMWNSQNHLLMDYLFPSLTIRQRRFITKIIFILVQTNLFYQSTSSFPLLKQGLLSYQDYLKEKQNLKACKQDEPWLENRWTKAAFIVLVGFVALNSNILS